MKSPHPSYHPSSAYIFSSRGEATPCSFYDHISINFYRFEIADTKMITNLAVFLLGTTRTPKPPQAQLSEYDSRLLQIATTWGSQLQHLYFVFGRVRTDESGELIHEDYNFLKKHCRIHLSSVDSQLPTGAMKPVALKPREKKRMRREKTNDRISRRLSSAKDAITGPMRAYLHNSTTLYQCPSNATGGPDLYPSVAINVLLTANCTRLVLYD
jgi:hypothetical protein